MIIFVSFFKGKFMVFLFQFCYEVFVCLLKFPLLMLSILLRLHVNVHQYNFLDLLYRTGEWVNAWTLREMGSAQGRGLEGGAWPT
jgi:hypothetical protein